MKINVHGNDIHTVRSIQHVCHYIGHVFYTIRAMYIYFTYANM